MYIYVCLCTCPRECPQRPQEMFAFPGSGLERNCVRPIHSSGRAAGVRNCEPSLWPPNS